MNLLTNGFKLLSNNKQTKTNTSNNSNLTNIYHEKQKKELCALHSLNNLFQQSFFTKEQLDQICVELSPQEWINPHRSLFGRGNYNINIIMKALHLKEHEAIWFDKRRPISILNFKNIKGFILNIPSDYKLAGYIPLPWERKHWVAVAKIGDLYYNLDSKLDLPETIGNEDQLKVYLENVIKSKDKEMFVIVEKQVELDSSWKL